MLTLAGLAALAAAHPPDRSVSAPSLRVGDREFDLGAAPVLMGCVNLSRDSTYRESIATSTESAARKARVMAAQGADLVDLGAESSTSRASRVEPAEQIATLVPVIERLTDEGIVVSTETYDADVARASLKAGATVLNLTGTTDQHAIFDLAAEYEATVILCYVGGSNVREITDVTVDDDPIPGLLEHFTERISLAESCGVRRLVIDPGMGFFYGNLIDPRTRAKHQATVLLNSYRLSGLGLPICNAMPHAFDMFEDQFRTAEGFFTVLAALGGTSLYRTHEVAQVRAVLETMRLLDTHQFPRPVEAE